MPVLVRIVRDGSRVRKPEIEGTRRPVASSEDHGGYVVKRYHDSGYRRPRPR